MKELQSIVDYTRAPDAAAPSVKSGLAGGGGTCCAMTQAPGHGGPAIRRHVGDETTRLTAGGLGNVGLKGRQLAVDSGWRLCRCHVALLWFPVFLIRKPNTSSRLFVY